MSADLRGFEYALEPVRQQRRWRVDSLRAELGRLQHALDEARTELERLRMEHAEHAAAVARSLAQRIDPGRHRLVMEWLLGLRKAIRAAEGLLAELTEARTDARLRCLAAEQGLEVIERHREECIEEHAQEMVAREAGELDREWLARRQWAATGRAPGEGDR